MKKNKNIILLSIMIFVIIILGGFIIYDKLILGNTIKKEENKEDKLIINAVKLHGISDYKSFNNKPAVKKSVIIDTMKLEGLKDKLNFVLYIDGNLYLNNNKILINEKVSDIIVIYDAVNGRNCYNYILTSSGNVYIYDYLHKFKNNDYSVEIVDGLSKVKEIFLASDGEIKENTLGSGTDYDDSDIMALKTDNKIVKIKIDKSQELLNPTIVPSNLNQSNKKLAIKQSYSIDNFNELEEIKENLNVKIYFDGSMYINNNKILLDNVSSSIGIYNYLYGLNNYIYITTYDGEVYVYDYYKKYNKKDFTVSKVEGLENITSVFDIHYCPLDLCDDKSGTEYDTDIIATNLYGNFYKIEVK